MRAILISLLLFVAPTAAQATARSLSADDINAAKPAKGEHATLGLNLKVQVLLDRARFSPGVIDGRRGDNFSHALRAFQQQNGLTASGELDAATFDKLAQDPAPVVSEYTISTQDVAGPFVREIPDDYAKKAELKRLDYTGPLEMLAERFHMDEELLAALNPGKRFDQAGTVILIANVSLKPVALRARIDRIEVDKKQKTVRVLAPDGKLVAFFPASIGSEEKPAPSGTLKVVHVAQNPTYTYNPAFRFDGVNADKELKIAPGPNNPVGIAWIALNKKTYGIHGTAEPEKVGKAGSHGCVRLTNWDALTLARMVRRGTVVEFLE